MKPILTILKFRSQLEKFREKFWILPNFSTCSWSWKTVFDRKIGNPYVTSLGHDSSALFSLKTIMAKTNFTNKKYVFMKIDFIRWGGNSKRSIFAVYTFFQFILEVFFWKWTYFFENQSKPNFIMAAVEFVWRSNLVTSSKTKRHQMTTNQNRRLTATIMKKALESRAI